MTQGARAAIITITAAGGVSRRWRPREKFSAVGARRGEDHRRDTGFGTTNSRPRASLLGWGSGVESDRHATRIGELTEPAHLGADQSAYGLDRAASSCDLRQDAL